MSERVQKRYVGYREGHAVDGDRSNWSGDGRRPLKWSAWYPAGDGASTAPLYLGSPQTALFYMGVVARDAGLRAEPSRFPVVLVSHGTGGSASSLGWLGCRLAASGFVVLGVDHHGNTINEPYRAEGFLCWWERATDLSVLLDVMHRTGPFAGRLDPDHVYAAGFSLGGYTVLSMLGAVTDMDRFRRWAANQPAGRGPREFPNLADEVAPLLERSAVFRESWRSHALPRADSRIKAAVALAPAPPVRAFTPASLALIDAPVSIAVGGADTEAPPDSCARWLHRHLPNSRLHDLGREVGHYVFLCEGTESGREVAPEICRDAPGIDRRKVHDRVASIVTDSLAPTVIPAVR